MFSSRVSAITSRVDLSKTSSSSSDEEEQYWLEECFVIFITVILATIFCEDLFHPTELTTEAQNWVNPNEGARNQLLLMQLSSSYFKTLTNFSVGEFEELCQCTVPTILTHARHTGLHRKSTGRPSKLELAQRLLSCLLYLKHANSVAFDAFEWNWSKFSLCDDAIYIASCVNKAIGNEIR